ncbi:histone-lysine N-methyltransferase, H3 lysine-9 specific SUVH6-like [Rhodamnia argentea]|uniref:Histone-lysine N-methyltransferase, H3 lysine-9 specific SUVH6-like n=1 Tax=Rhodamnia argentea TaxID=178133 RepID=A0ABM3HGE8_9MYRT|nr:histone-lysine N-methyltransferase, H3 lysine-9 specific SUVH6-like [Rhodamnia argentea]
MNGDSLPEKALLPREFVPDEFEKFICHHCGMVNDDVQIFPKEPETSVARDKGPKRKSPDRHEPARHRVMSTLALYREIIRELFLEKTKADKESIFIRRIDLYAAREVKKRVGYVHGTAQFIGEVPGVEVGDQFRYRMELVVVGLHRPPQGGIDYMGSHQDVLATSIVASWDYTDDLTNPGELVYLGQGGTLSYDKRAEDQSLTRGNLALVNSMKRNQPVRVIRKDMGHTFTYDGLYVVDRYRKIPGASGKMIFEFVLKRLPSQLEMLQHKRMKVVESSG